MMNNYILGIGTGLFLYWAGGLFRVLAKKTLEERREDAMRVAKENIEMIVNKVKDQINKGE